MERVLLTGAAGRIGRVLRPALREGLTELRLVDQEPVDPEANETYEQMDLRDFARVSRVVKGVDAIVHLAAIPGESPFPEILDNNIRTTFHILEAARRHGVARVVLASTNHVTGLYPRDVRIGPESPPRPDTFYGVGKVCDEALGRLYAEKFGLEVAALRIGSFDERPEDERALATWISHPDLVDLVQRCLTAPTVTFTVVYGVSDNAGAWWDNPAADAIGYAPNDAAEDHLDEIAPPTEDEDRLREQRARRWQGGWFGLPETSTFDDTP
jgi:uronate dehydrogenase